MNGSKTAVDIITRTSPRARKSMCLSLSTVPFMKPFARLVFPAGRRIEEETISSKGTIEKCFTTQFTNLWTWFSDSPDGIMLDKLGNWINATWPHNQSDPRHLISSLVELFLPKGHSDETKIYWHITTPVDKHFHARMGFHGRLSSLKSCLQVLNKIANHLIESSFGLSKLDYQTVH